MLTFKKKLDHFITNTVLCYESHLIGALCDEIIGRRKLPIAALEKGHVSISLAVAVTEGGCILSTLTEGHSNFTDKPNPNLTKAVNQPSSQAVNQSIKQPSSQSTKQPVNQMSRLSDALPVKRSQ
nr:PREDICTED: uncharacterized protein LOC105662511 [Megachile rotundata]